MSHINKVLSERDANQTLQSAYNDVDATISTNGFLVGKVGNQVALAISTTTVANDTETYTFFDNATQLYQIRIIYTDGSRNTIITATRIS
jgi:hypothetical protein